MTSSITRGSALMRRPSARAGVRRRGRRRLLTALGFLAPALVMLGIVRLVPAGEAVVASLHHFSLSTGEESWVGLANYLDLFGNPRFQGSLATTLLFAVIINPLQIVVALLLALLYTHHRTLGSPVWRTLVILPVAAPPAVSAIIWGAIYRPDGLANALLAVVGLPSQPFLTSAVQALVSLIILMSWAGVGYWMLFLIAGLNDVPRELYEAATLDGASAWRRFWHITLPMIRRPLAFVLVADTVANFLVFAPVQMLTQGGPEGSTNLLMYDIYTRAYTFSDLNTASAEVVVLVAITLVIVAIQFRLLRSAE